MIPAYIQQYGICSPLGCDTDKAFLQVMNGHHGLVKKINGRNQTQEILGALKKETIEAMEALFPEKKYSFFEKMCLYAVQNAVNLSNVNTRYDQCLFLLSTTKGNISSLSEDGISQQSLFESAQRIAQYFNNPNRPLFVSNACISGVLALILAKDYIESGKYKDVVVIGCDQLSDFTINGFQSFQALAPELCRPFDKGRKGLNLGEAAACMILSDRKPNENNTAIRLSGGGLTNDANHLSGPSRTGEELAEAIRQALTEAALTPEEVQMISAHGTATRYNDEMEAKALALASVNATPLHSLKSYIGHTLGAAGIIETVFAAIAMKKNILIPSLNFRETDVPVSLNVCTSTQPAMINHVLKTASGFGGCNAALVLSKC